MAEEPSPESKLYVKEEIEKARKEVKEEVEKVKSTATKTFTTVAIVVGLLTGLGVYGLAKNYIDTTINLKLGAETLAKIQKDLEKLSDLKTELEKHQLAEENGYAWIGGVKFIWGYEWSTTDLPQKIYFKEKFPKKCLAVIPALPGYVYESKADYFEYQRVPVPIDKPGEPPSKQHLCYVAIGY